jgi:hypothetical protein
MYVRNLYEDWEQKKIKRRQENIPGYLESESYPRVYRALNAIVEENEASGELPSLETSRPSM